MTAQSKNFSFVLHHWRGSGEDNASELNDFRADVMDFAARNIKRKHSPQL